MGIFANAAAEAAARAAQKEALKKGKSLEQKRAIEFFFDEGGCGCLAPKGDKPFTMEEYLGLVQRKLSSLNIRQKAIHKIGLDESQIQEIPPIALASFVYDDDCLIRANATTAVSSQYSVTWLFFSREQVYAYKYIFDTTSDRTWEYTDDFFYRDITCFATGHEVKEDIKVTQSSGCFGSKENVIKNLYTVDTLAIIVPGTKYKVSIQSNPNVENSIQAAKQMLREKKYG